jgi:hypothetical protein
MKGAMIATAGGAVGWFATISATESAQVFAGVATGLWMVAQTFVLVRRQRCTRFGCLNRK